MIVGVSVSADQPANSRDIGTTCGCRDEAIALGYDTAIGRLPAGSSFERPRQNNLIIGITVELSGELARRVGANLVGYDNNRKTG